MAQEMAYSHTYTIINIDLIELYIWSIISSPLVIIILLEAQLHIL